jgi:hypothetical protein
MNSHGTNADRARKQKEGQQGKNNKEDQKGFVGCLLREIMDVKLYDYSPTDTSVDDPTVVIENAIDNFTKLIKDDVMVRNTIASLNDMFTLDAWHNLFYKRPILSLSSSKDPSDMRDLKMIKYMQRGRFINVLLLFHFVHILMNKYKKDITTCNFVILMRGCYISWLLIAIKALQDSRTEENADVVDTVLSDVNTRYIDLWSFNLFVLESNSETSTKTSFYKKVMSKEHLKQLRACLGVNDPVESAVANDSISKDTKVAEDKSCFVSKMHKKYKKRKAKAKGKLPYEFRKVAAFEVHKVVVRLHYTKHLMRNYVPFRSLKTYDQLMEQIRDCPYEFRIRFEKKEDSRISNGGVCIEGDKIVQDNMEKNQIDCRIDFINTPHKLIMEGTDIWVEFEMDLPFIFTSCFASVIIKDIHSNDLGTRKLFGLDNNSSYIGFGVDNYGMHSNYRLWDSKNRKVQHQVIERNAFYFGNSDRNLYENGDFICYDTASDSLLPISAFKIPIKLYGRPMVCTINKSSFQQIK